MAHKLPKLPYGLDGLEPHYKASTMEIHYGKHHQAYVDKLNAALEGTGHEDMAIEELLQNLDKLPADKKKAVTNNGGGHYNHTLFWYNLGPNAGGEANGKVGEKIKEAFGDFAGFQEKFTAQALAVFGSGWAWLVANKDGSVSIEGSPNQENCLMNSDKKPIMVLDVWEHAYYLEHQNRRPDFAKVFWNMVNWDQVNTNYDNAMAGKAIISESELVTA